MISLPKMEGPRLSSEMSKVWQGVAASECRLDLMRELMCLNVGFGEVENFNLDLCSKFRSNEFKEKLNEKQNPEVKVVRAAMELKLRDEDSYHGELKSEQHRLRKEIGQMCMKNSKTYRLMLKILSLFS